jgi:osmotically-inducible protein OsmY
MFAMKRIHPMKSDNDIQQDVRDEIKWDARTTASDIGVTVKDGVVSLSGTTGHFIQKTAAEEAAQRVAGVRAVANEIKVKFFDFSFKRNDQDIAEAALNALRWEYQVPEKNIKVSVSDGAVTLRGHVEWAYQREAACDCVRSLHGVTDVINEIDIKPSLHPSDIKARIEAAFRRSADADSKAISVSVSGNRVTLSGNVHSMAEKDDAGWSALCAPGVSTVDNNLSVSAH